MTQRFLIISCFSKIRNKCNNRLLIPVLYCVKNIYFGSDSADQLVLIMVRNRIHPEGQLTTDLRIRICNYGWEFPTKNNSAEYGIDETNSSFIPRRFWLFRGTENSRNSIANHSAVEKKAWNSVLWNKKRSKLSEFCSEPFREREKCSAFRSVEQKLKQTIGTFRGRKHALDSV